MPIPLRVILPFILSMSLLTTLVGVVVMFRRLAATSGSKQEPWNSSNPVRHRVEARLSSPSTLLPLTCYSGMSYFSGGGGGYYIATQGNRWTVSSTSIWLTSHPYDGQVVLTQS